MAVIDRLRALLAKLDPDQEYEPLESGFVEEDGRTHVVDDDGVPFSWLEYSVFLLLGIAMLWAWYASKHHS